jgi:hypothetical protein
VGGRTLGRGSHSVNGLGVIWAENAESQVSRFISLLVLLSRNTIDNNLLLIKFSLLTVLKAVKSRIKVQAGLMSGEGCPFCFYCGVFDPHEGRNVVSSNSRRQRGREE